MCHLNIQCLRNKTDLLEAYLVDKDYDIVCLSEHWLGDDEIAYLRFDNYVVISHFCRSIRMHGGVLILAKKGLKCINNYWIPKLSIEFVCELASIYIPADNIHVITVYRTKDSDIVGFEGVMNDILDRLTGDSRASVIVNGDFNVYFNKTENATLQFLDLMASFGLNRTIFESTRLNNCLDNVFTNCVAYTSFVEKIYLSDHYAVNISLLLDAAETGDCKYVVRQPITPEGLFVLHNLVQSIDWAFLNLDGYSLENKTENFLSLLKHCVDDSFPQRTIRVTSDSPLKVNWYSDELRDMREMLWFLREAASSRNSPVLKNMANIFYGKCSHQGTVLLLLNPLFSNQANTASFTTNTII